MKSLRVGIFDSVKDKRNLLMYYYGAIALIKQGVGIVLIVLGLVIGLLVGISWNWIAGMIAFLFMVACGLFFYNTGKAQRFDYQKQSGMIIHQGDGNWGGKTGGNK
jgi:cbb3-type cytochrome oxidase subunit 3